MFVEPRPPPQASIPYEEFISRICDVADRDEFPRTVAGAARTAKYVTVPSQSQYYLLGSTDSD